MCDPHGAAEWHCGRYAHDPHPRFPKIKKHCNEKIKNKYIRYMAPDSI